MNFSRGISGGKSTVDVVSLSRQGVSPPESSLLCQSREVLAAQKNLEKRGLSAKQSKWSHLPSTVSLLGRVVSCVMPGTQEGAVAKERKKLDHEVKRFAKALLSGDRYEEGLGPSDKSLSKSDRIAKECLIPQLDRMEEESLDASGEMLAALARFDFSKIPTSRLTDFVIKKLTQRDQWDEETRPLLLALGGMICAELETREPDLIKLVKEAESGGDSATAVSAKATLRDIRRTRFVLSSLEQSSGFCKENRVGEHQRLGGGELNTVYTSTYLLPGSANPTTVVYKPVAPPQNNLDYDASGSEPRYNVAVCKIAQAFKEYDCEDIIVDTHYASDAGETGIVMEYIDNGQCPVSGKSQKIAEIPIDASGLSDLVNAAPWDGNGRALPDPVYLREEGIECYPQYSQLYMSLLGSEYPQDMYEIRKEGDNLVIYGPEMAEVDYTQAEVRRDAVWLQIIDIMTGQTDRHDNNMFFILNAEGGYERLAAFDNDQCYRRDACPTALEVSRNPNLLLLPQVMDVSMVAGIMGMNDAKLEALLGDDLTPQELDNQKKILKQMQRHCEWLLANDRVIGSGDWGSDQAGEWLAYKEGDAYSSYIGRIVEGNKNAKAATEQLKEKFSS